MTLYAGTTTTVQVDLDVWGDDTAVTLHVANPDGTAADPATTAVDYGVPELAGKSWRARVPWAAAGLPVATWTVIGTGATTIVQRYAVAPATDDTDTRLSYATPTDLANYLHDAPPLDADRRLKDASEVIDDALLCAIYDVDDDGIATDPVYRAAIVEATCEQARWRMEVGDDDGASMYTSVSIAGVSMSRAASATGAAGANPTAPKVGPILARAGLTGFGPWTY